MPPSDVAFTFDPMPVLDGIRRIDQGMSNLSKGFQKSGASMSRSVALGVVKATAAVGALVGAVKGLGRVLNRMPEIGQAFGIAKDVFFRNFLFPIRKELMPLLQQMLDWVRDNRALFVRWGAVVVRLVRGVVNVVRTLIRALQSVGRGLLRWMGLDSLDEFVNILQFKVATIILAVKILAGSVAGFVRNLWKDASDEAATLGKNLLDSIVTIGQDILGWMSRFASGFASTFDVSEIVQNVLKVWGGLVDTFNNLWNAIFGGGRGEKWGKFFEGLGKLAGASFTLLAASLREVYDIILDFVNDLINTPAFQKLMDFLASLAQAAGGALTKGAEFLGGLTEKLTSGREEREAGRAATSVFENPTISKFPFGIPTGGASPSPAGATANTITIQVSGAGNPEEVGAAVVDALNRQVNLEGQAAGKF